MPLIDGREIIYRALRLEHYDAQLLLLRLDESQVPVRQRKTVREALIKQADAFHKEHGKKVVVTIYEAGFDEKTTGC